MGTSLLKFLFGFLTFFSILNSHAETIIKVNPIADAMVSSQYPQSNYGSALTLAANNGKNIIQSYLKFTVSGISTSTVASAKLRLYITNASADGAKLVLSDANWYENSVSYSSRPGISNTMLDDKGSVTANTWVEYDVTSAVHADGTYSFALIGTSSDRMGVKSRESNYKPELVISFADSNSTAAPTPAPTPSPTPVPVSGTPARQADSVVDSLGVTAHLNWGGSIYDTAYAQYKPLLGSLGIRYVRTNPSSSALSKFQDLYSSYGIKFNMTMMLLDSNGILDPSSIPGKLAYVRDTIGVDKVLSIEGANEYNDRRSTDLNWAAEDRDYQMRLYTSVRSDRAFDNIPVIGPSIWKRIYEDFVAIGNIDQYVDFPNLHYYTFNRKPTLFSGGTMDDAINWAKLIAPSANCVWTTETGYDAQTPQDVAAIYMLRMDLEFYNRCGNGSGKVFEYDLIDDTKNFGMLDANLNPRPVYYAVKNLIKILSDKGPAFTPTSLNYSLSGDLTNIHKTILQKRDGRFYLTIWQDVDSQNSIGAWSNPPKRPLTLDVHQHAFSKMNVYYPTALGMSDPNNGALPAQSVTTPSVLTINVPDHVMILEFIP
jgi:hypothetical protein